MHAVPKLPSGFNTREVVYRQMELIKAETVEKMNELLEGVNFVSITSDSWTANHQHFLSVVVHGISSDFKNHLILPLPLAKLDLLGSGDIVEKCLRVFLLLFLARGLLLQQQTMGQP